MKINNYYFFEGITNSEKAIAMALQAFWDSEKLTREEPRSFYALVAKTFKGCWVLFRIVDHDEAEIGDMIFLPETIQMEMAHRDYDAFVWHSLIPQYFPLDITMEAMAEMTVESECKEARRLPIKVGGDNVLYEWVRVV